MNPFKRLPGAASMKWPRLRTSIIVLFVLGVGLWGLTYYWSIPPETSEPSQIAKRMAPADVDPSTVTGYTTAATLAHVTNALLDKPGGYMSNDVLPPFVFMDNMPAWEYGAVRQMRDLAASMRNDMSRSRSQSDEDPDLAVAEPQFNFPTNSWIFPATESEYQKGVRKIRSYMTRLTGDGDADFYARADNLNSYLALVNKRLGNLSQRLSASVGSYRINTNLAGDPSARQTKAEDDDVYTETPWLQIDNVYYEARGSTWALIHFLRAVRIDFKDVLDDKNAMVSLRQIIRELEHTQRTMYSPTVLNGNPYGLFANHSLILSSYIARANAAIIDLRELLSQG